MFSFFFFFETLWKRPSTGSCRFLYIFIWTLSSFCTFYGWTLRFGARLKEEEKGKEKKKNETAEKHPTLQRFSTCKKEEKKKWKLARINEKVAIRDSIYWHCWFARRWRSRQSQKWQKKTNKKKNHKRWGGKKTLKLWTRRFSPREYCIKLRTEFSLLIVSC